MKQQLGAAGASSLASWLECPCAVPAEALAFKF